jgi:DNA uptake protein and related DNA-binding proteins
MPTPAEQKALAFVALVVLLGGAVRVVRGSALSPVAPTTGEQQALARQTYAASSTAVAAAAQKGRKKGNPAGKAPRRRYAGAKFDSTGVLIEGTGVVSPTGFPPPGPRIDIDSRPSPPAGASNGAAVPDARRIDLDVAPPEEIERLPRVGPTLARRIVANRDSLGPFGSLAGLRRVKGMGPATIERLAKLVTFSGQTRR